MYNNLYCLARNLISHCTSKTWVHKSHLLRKENLVVCDLNIVIYHGASVFSTSLNEWDTRERERNVRDILTSLSTAFSSLRPYSIFSLSLCTAVVIISSRDSRAIFPFASLSTCWNNSCKHTQKIISLDNKFHRYIVVSEYFNYNLAVLGPYLQEN